MLQPIIVTKKDDYYEIVAGERRWRACKKAGLTEIPAIIRDDDERRNKEIDEQYNKFMNDKDFQGKFDYILYNNYDSESEKQILDLVKNLIVNE